MTGVHVYRERIALLIVASAEAFIFYLALPSTCVAWTYDAHCESLWTNIMRASWPIQYSVIWFGMLIAALVVWLWPINHPKPNGGLDGNQEF